MADYISAWLQAQGLQGSAAADGKGEHEKSAIWYTYPKLLIQKAATGPGPIFNLREQPTLSC